MKLQSKKHTYFKLKNKKNFVIFYNSNLVNQYLNNFKTISKKVNQFYKQNKRKYFAILIINFP